MSIPSTRVKYEIFCSYRKAADDTCPARIKIVAIMAPDTYDLKYQNDIKGAMAAVHIPKKH